MAQSAPVPVLPAYRHVPGKNERPVDGFLDHIVVTACQITHSDQASANPAWQYSLRLFNAGYYWEAHEVMEVLWNRALPNSREKFLIQGVIHMANAALKISMGRPAASEKLLHLAQAAFIRSYQGGCLSVMGLSQEQLGRLSGDWAKAGGSSGTALTLILDE